jgi:hypothetical protein
MLASSFCLLFGGADCTGVRWLQAGSAYRVAPAETMHEPEPKGFGNRRVPVWGDHGGDLMHELRARLQGRGPKLIADKPAARHGAEMALAVDMIRRAESRLNDNRSEGRQRLEAEEILLETDCGIIPLKLINLSQGGAMLEGDFQLTLFSHVVLLLPGNHRLQCVVRWLKKDRAGVEFETGTGVQLDAPDRRELVRSLIAKTFPDFDLAQLQSPARQVGAPDRAPREALTWIASLLHDHESTPVRLRNISSSGALVELRRHIPQNSDVVLDLGQAGCIHSVVVWAFGDQIGLRFDSPFDLRLLVQAMPKASTGPEGESVDLDQLSQAELQSFLEGYLKH